MLLKITTGDVSHPPWTGGCWLKIATGDSDESNVQSHPSYYSTPVELLVLTLGTVLIDCSSGVSVHLFGCNCYAVLTQSLRRYA